MKTVVVLNQDQMGHGDRALGQKILATFLRKSLALGSLRAIVLYNSGVRLVTKDSPVLAELAQLHEAGVDIRPCGTCLEALELAASVAVSKPSNMDEIVAELAAAEKVITL
mgnify:CR=1 FL=1